MKIRMILSASLLVLSLLGAPMREISLCEAYPAKPAPVIDGRLDEPVWKKAPAYSTYYDFSAPHRKNPALKTELRLLFNEKGIYVGIVNFEPETKKICHTVEPVVKDDPNLWRDDCAELYFDPDALGIGFTQFVVNANGAVGDLRRQDRAVVFSDWNGDGWTAKARIHSDRWCAEIFIPWTDLGRKASCGDLWRFSHIRYAWARGFQGISSSIGASFRNADKLGYLYFSDGKESMTAKKAAAQLSGKAALPWCIPFGRTLVVQRAPGKTEFADLANLIAEAEKKRDRISNEIENEGGHVPGWKLPEGNTLDRLNALNEVNGKLFDLKWKNRLEKEFD